MSETVDQIQSQQIATLIGQVSDLQASQADIASLQAQITALQAIVAVLQQQMLTGPSGWAENWVIT